MRQLVRYMGTQAKTQTLNSVYMMSAQTLYVGVSSHLKLIILSTLNVTR